MDDKFLAKIVVSFLHPHISQVPLWNLVMLFCNVIYYHIVLNFRGRIVIFNLTTITFL